MAYRGQVWTAGLTLEAYDCPTCGMTYGITPGFNKARSRDHAVFSLPCGHTTWFSAKTEAEKLRDELAREKHASEQARADALHWRGEQERTDRKLRATKGVVTRIKNRVGAGVCPCCKRTFQNLRRHMTGQHPSFAGSPGE